MVNLTKRRVLSMIRTRYVLRRELRPTRSLPTPSRGLPVVLNLQMRRTAKNAATAGRSRVLKPLP